MSDAIPKTRALLSLVSKRGDASVNLLARRLSRHVAGPDSFLRLDQAESTALDEALAELATKYASDKSLSVRIIERSLNSSVVYVADPGKQRESMPAQRRVARAIRKLRESLSRPLVDYTVYVPFDGWRSDDLPRVFGSVRFTVFGDYHLRQLRADAARHLVAEDQLASRRSVVRDLRRSPLWRRPCAIVRVPARDHDAALELGRDEVRLRLECLGFFDGMVPYNYGAPYLIGEGGAGIATSVIRKVDRSFFIPSEAVNVSHFSLGNLDDGSLPIRRTLKRLNRALVAPAEQDLESAIVAGASWIGSATVGRPSDAFLKCMVALESLLLPVSNKGAISYRLRLRAAQLLGKTAKGRKQMRERIRALYRIRNQIVHEGRPNVGASQVAEARSVAQSAVVRIATRRGVSHLRTCQDLETWFEDRAAS